MDLKNRKDIVFLVLAGFFITNAIVAELIGGKLVQFFGLFTQSIGIILWPVIFLLTAFDFFGELSEPKREKEFVENGKLSQEALNNRLLLRTVMMKAGFTTITSEWWHFNATNKVTAAARYELIE